MSQPKRLRILIVTPSLPYPQIWGFGIRVYQVIKHLAERHDVSVIAYARPDEQDSVAALSQTGAKIYPVLRENPSVAAKRQAQFTSLFSPTSFQRRGLESAAMQQALDCLLDEREFDVIQVESSQMAGFRFNSRAALLVDEHNIEYELLYRTFRTEPSPVRKLYNWIEYRKFRREELRSWNASDGCIVTSDREALILRQHSPNKPTVVVPNGVDVDFFRPTDVSPDVNNVAFVGVMNYRPNVDGALYFAREILPLLIRERPKIKFSIIGGGPPDELRRLAGEHIEVTGRVPDTRPYLARAGACVVPLRMGSGTRLKVLEGLAMGKPIVSTSVGCEGIDTIDGEHLLVADDPASFANSVSRILDQQSLVTNMARRGRELVERRYSWGSVLRELDGFLVQQVSVRSSRRPLRLATKAS